MRKYFGYWLNTCASFLDDQIVNDSKIIIIIDGIDYLRDSYLKREAIPAFWFPNALNRRIKFIVTSYGYNSNLEYFDKFDSLKMEIYMNKNLDFLKHR